MNIYECDSVDVVGILRRYVSCLLHVLMKSCMIHAIVIYHVSAYSPFVPFYFILSHIFPPFFINAGVNGDIYCNLEAICLFSTSHFQCIAFYVCHCVYKMSMDKQNIQKEATSCIQHERCRWSTLSVSADTIAVPFCELQTACSTSHIYMPFLRSMSHRIFETK